ncbi:MAG: SMC-Scp complex subunit ScpB [Oscillospiraceae bacterium]|nr:SMC-Scp complex subunit ScpB [Oscillospiraceae bacterium]
MNANKVQAAVEAILFAAGDPVQLSKLSEALEIEPELCERILTNLSDNLDERGSGLCLVKLGDRYQLCTRTEYSEEIRKLLEMRRNVPLSQAAFEVLAVIAYNQPVTKSFVEQVRGVDCSGVIASLSQKGLIEERGRLDLPGKPLIYGTTPAFLRCFCIESLDELPALPGQEAEKTETEE